ncbi:4'-phosphopantetheinyl transferase family protein [Streptomyces sp. STR69]|uniref:4'-phosphopantetheinyl transferase family protein n=1 Tax=Streptomyces sp. STR69 TaxID=1796942 RepID=UPI0021C9AF2E|nr:4'-phosphopantetheinyl transferase superfamily protein [Streptomyces sp. STR69]
MNGFTHRSAAPGVHYAAAPCDRVLRSLPAHPADRAAARTLDGTRATEFLAVRSLLRALLRVLAPGLPGPVIAAHDTGRPHLPQHPDTGISFSHSGGWAAVCVGFGRQVGVDIEVPGPMSPQMVRRCCTPRDAARLSTLPGRDRETAFAWLWTAQEACVKALGTGLAGAPWTVPVGIGQRGGTWNGVRWRAQYDASRIPLTCAFTAACGPRTRP